MAELTQVGCPRTSKDDQIYEDYIGLGPAHRKPPAKRIKLDQEEKTDDPPEPRSVDVFQSQESDGYQTPPEDMETENTQKATAAGENDDDEVPDSQEAHEKERTDEPEYDSDDHSLEIDESFNTNYDKTYIEEQKQKKEKSSEQLDSTDSEEEEELLNGMRIDEREETTNRKSNENATFREITASSKTDHKDAEDVQSSPESPNHTLPTSTPNKPHIQTPSNQSAAVSPSVSTPPSSKQSETLYKSRLNDQSESFRSKNLQFLPDLESCDAERNYVYCEIPGLPFKPKRYRSDSDSSSKVLLDQVWRSKLNNGTPNPQYAVTKMLLQNYLKEYKIGGFRFFEGLILDMMQYGVYKYEELSALWGYFEQKTRELGKEQPVLEKFAQLVRVALSAEEVLPERIYRLVDGVESATLSHEQCGALIARLFFVDQELSFANILKSKRPLGIEKVKFIMNYIDKIATDPPQGAVTFRKITVNERTFEQRQFERKDCMLPETLLIDGMNIEDTALCTQVDFANAYLGGGVLREGSVQEEIRFLMCPEMIVGMLLTEKIKSTEAISIVGAYVYSSYDGYGSRLKWAPLRDQHSRQNSPEFRDRFGRLRTETIAIDATRFQGDHMSTLNEQLQPKKIQREVVKAFAGFACQDTEFNDIPIVSGWWGCGAFRGNKPLKFLIQVVAAGLANRPLHMCPFQDDEMATKCRKMISRLRKKNVTVGKLLDILLKIPQSHSFTEQYAFDAICNFLGSETSPSSSK